MSSSALDLPEQLMTGSVSELFESLQHLLDTGEPLVLNGSAVESVDFGGLQVLLALSVTLAKRQVPLHWNEPSDTLVRASQLAGMNEALGLTV